MIKLIESRKIKEIRNCIIIFDFNRVKGSFRSNSQHCSNSIPLERASTIRFIGGAISNLANFQIKLIRIHNLNSSNFQYFSVRTGTSDLRSNQLLHADPGDGPGPRHRRAHPLRHRVGQRARLLPPGPEKRHPLPETRHRPGRRAKPALEHVHSADPRLPGGQPS